MIHAYSSYPGGFIALHLSKKYGVPYVISEQMSPFPFKSFINGGTIDEILTKPAEKANAIISPSTSAANNICELIPKGNVEVIPNFIDDSKFKPTDPEKNGKRILNIGRLEEQKDQSSLLKAFSIIVKEDHRIELIIGGSGSQEDKLKEFCEQLGISQYVRFLGELNQTEVIREMRSCSFFCLSSLHESFGIVLIEALACGKPIISTACGGPEDIVNDSNGLLAKTADPEDLADKIQYMIEKYDRYDPKVIRNDFESRFSSTVITPKIIELYQRVITESEIT